MRKEILNYLEEVEGVVLPVYYRNELYIRL